MQHVCADQLLPSPVPCAHPPAWGAERSRDGWHAAGVQPQYINRSACEAIVRELLVDKRQRTLSGLHGTRIAGAVEEGKSVS